MAFLHAVRPVDAHSLTALPAPDPMAPPPFHPPQSGMPSPAPQEPVRRVWCSIRQIPSGTSLLASLFTGAVTGVGGYLTSPPLSPWLWSAAGTSLVISGLNGIACACQGSSENIRKALEAAVGKATQEIQSLKGSIADFQHQVEQLQGTATTLGTTVAHEATEDSQLTQTLHAHEATIGRLEEQLRSVQGQLQTAMRLKTEWESIASRFIGKMTEFDARIQELVPNRLARLEEGIGAVAHAAESASMNLERVQGLQARMDGYLRSILETTKGLQDTVGLLQQDVERKKAEVTTQQQSIERLRETNAELQENTTKAEALIGQFQGLVDQYTRAQSRFGQVKVKLEQLEHPIEGTPLTTTYVQGIVREALDLMTRG